ALNFCCACSGLLLALRRYRSMSALRSLVRSLVAIGAKQKCGRDRRNDANDRCCRKRVLRKTTAQYRFKIKRRYAILIQRKECPDSIISKFNSTVLSWILFRQHRPISDINKSISCHSISDKRGHSGPSVLKSPVFPAPYDRTKTFASEELTMIRIA